MRGALLMTLALLAAAPSLAEAATIVIVNNDGIGEGFNDPTPAAPVGGNPGVTLGQQRLNVFQAAANIWGSILPSAVTIRVQAQFNPQTCSPTSAVLGSAGPIEVYRDFSGAELPGTWYHVALANRLAGTDLNAGANDINATFNSDLDNSTCLGTTDWYYGLDGNEGSDIELLPVVLHELGHGLGFSTLVGSNGAELVGFPDVYETFIRDNTLGLTWNQMTQAQRAASAINTGNVVWSGPAATFQAPSVLQASPTLFVNSPPALPATMTIGTASFGAALTEVGVTGDVVLVDDGSGTTSDGCQPLVNAGAVAGNIALIDRGTCTFASKAQAAQAAGAIGVIIVNNVAGGGAPGLGGTDPSIIIPVVSVSLEDGNLIKAQLGVGVNVTIGLDPANRAGADAAGRVKLYAPNPYEGGSSISHWDVTALPNLLMEPAINPDLSGDVDLSLAHFADIGWIADCVSAACPADTSVLKNTVVELDFCVTNCGDVADSILVEINDSEGWIAPVSQKVYVPASGQVCIPVAVPVPDDCGAAPTTIGLSAQSSFGGSDVCTMTVTPLCGPQLQLEPPAVFIPTVALGDTTCDSIRVINAGDQPLTVGSVTGCDADGFFLDLSGLPAVIAPGDSGTVTVCFSPVVAGANACAISVVTDGGSGNVPVEVGGTTGTGSPGFGTVLVLAPVSPTPFSGAAEVRFTLPREDRVQVEVFDSRGRLVRTLLRSETIPAGEQVLAWDGRNERGGEVPGGVYFVRVATRDHGAKVIRAVRTN